MIEANRENFRNKERVGVSWPISLWFPHAFPQMMSGVGQRNCLFPMRSQGLQVHPSDLGRLRSRWARRISSLTYIYLKIYVIEV